MAVYAILKNCQIKPSKVATNLEIVLHFESSDIIFNLANLEMLGTKLLDTAEPPTTKEYERVTIRAQVIKLTDPEK